MNTLNIYAAGSLRFAFPALVELFKQQSPIDIEVLFSPAGLLREKIEQNIHQPIAHLFASANTAHPQTLVDQGIATSHTIFAKNRLCMIVRNEPMFTQRDFMTILLDDKTRIGMSTPKKDPSGDYTFSLFDGIDIQYPGQGTQLKQRAMQLVGGEFASALPTGIRPAEYFLLNDSVDVFIGYANYAPHIQQNAQLAIIDLPTDYYQPINYSIALLTHPHPYAHRFIDFILSQDGQNCLQQNGFIGI